MADNLFKESWCLSIPLQRRSPNVLGSTFWSFFARFPTSIFIWDAIPDGHDTRSTISKLVDPALTTALAAESKMADSCAPLSPSWLRLTCVSRRGAKPGFKVERMASILFKGLESRFDCATSPSADSTSALSKTLPLIRIIRYQDGSNRCCQASRSPMSSSRLLLTSANFHFRRISAAFPLLPILFGSTASSCEAACANLPLSL
ncbi:hypothetical protein RRF57_012828 [Xylaria bambusicola]|uniref:Uncharacterized protein n=1 Tax=Xylaria bambusicola TaxID=326684 RepID=A0AAN7ZB35_9PEZI